MKPLTSDTLVSLGYNLFLGMAWARILAWWEIPVTGSALWALLWIALVAALISVPLLGLLIDSRANLPAWTALTGGLVLVLLGVANPLGLSHPPVIYTLIAALTILVNQSCFYGLSSRQPLTLQIRTAAYGLSLFAIAFVAFTWYWSRRSGSPGLAYLAVLGLGLVCSIVFYSQPWAIAVDQTASGQTAGPVRAGIGRFFRESDPFRVFKAGIGFWFLFATGFTAFLLFLMAQTAGLGDSSLYGFGLLMAVGAFATPPLAEALGPKRAISSMLLFILLLLVMAMVAREDAVFFVIFMGLAFSAGAGFSAALGLWAWFVPSAHAAQGFGYCLMAATGGALIGRALFLQTPIALLALYLSLIFMLALFLVQVISYNHARLAADNDGNPYPGFDWRFAGIARDAAPTGLMWRVMQATARLLAEIFFARIRIVGGANLAVPGGAILVANHPNTFLDPILVSAVAPARLFFWAKSTFWNFPMLGSLLDRMGALPVSRKLDNPQPDAAGNRKTMAEAQAKLNQGGWILIFPEGMSVPGLSLKPLKTGAVRLGFQTLDAANWSRDLPIITVGLDYMEPRFFRSHVTIRIGQPIWLSSYEGDYRADQIQTVIHATRDVANQLQGLLPHLNEPDLERLTHQIQDLYGERILQILGEADATSARQAVARALNHYQHTDPEAVLLFSGRMDIYQRESERLATPQNHPPIPLRDLLRIFATLVFSGAGYGILVNWLPYKLIRRLVGWLAPIRQWAATVKLVVGMLVFFFYYSAVGLICGLIFNPFIAILLVLSFMLSALVALGSIERFSIRFSQLKALWQAFWTQDTNDDLEAMKLELIQDLERFRESYAFYIAQEGSP